MAASATETASLRTYVGQRLITKPAEPDHIVQFYEDEGYLAGVVAEFLATGIAASEPVVVIATEAHTKLFIHELNARGLDVEGAIRSGQIEFHDANQTLSSFLVDGFPNRERFRAVIGPVLERCAARGCHVRVRAYGEMVDLLCAEGNGAGAAALEGLWNEMGRSHSFSLLCAYRISRFNNHSHGLRFHELCRTHAHVLPAESYSQIEDPDERLLEVSLLQQRALALESELEIRKSIEAALRKALDVREQFLAVAGHELRTPITTLGLKLHTLGREAEDESDSPFVERVRVHATRLTDQVNRLARLANDLIDAARIADGKVHINFEEIDLPAAVRSVASRFEELAATVSSPVEILGPDRIFVRADRIRLEQVIGNLLENGIKYGAGKPIRISIERQGTMASLSVTDRGPGMTPEALAWIFERFDRTPASRTRGGLGLGLFITRTLVQSMSGSIRAESKPGRGSTFFVALPLATPELAAQIAG